MTRAMALIGALMSLIVATLFLLLIPATIILVMLVEKKLDTKPTPTVGVGLTTPRVNRLLVADWDRGTISVYRIHETCGERVPARRLSVDELRGINRVCELRSVDPMTREEISAVLRDPCGETRMAKGVWAWLLLEGWPVCEEDGRLVFSVEEF